MTNFLDAFVEHAVAHAPPEFLEMAGYLALSGVARRNVYLPVNRQPMFLNVYMIIVAPAGAGKSQALMATHRLLQSIDGVRLGPESLTGAALYDALQSSASVDNEALLRGETDAGKCEMTIICDELGMTLQDVGDEIVTVLTKAHDCVTFQQGRRSFGTMTIRRPYLVFGAGATPAFVQRTIPASAWKEGWASRCLFLFGDSSKRKKLVLNEEIGGHGQTNTPTPLIDAAKALTKLSGLMRFTPEALKFILSLTDSKRWAEDAKDCPERMQTYYARRDMHLLKLSGLRAFGGGRLEVSLDDVERAWDFQQRVEKTMVEGVAVKSVATQLVEAQQSNPHISTTGLMDRALETGVSQASAVSIVNSLTLAGVLKGKRR